MESFRSITLLICGGSTVLLLAVIGLSTWYRVRQQRGVLKTLGLDTVACLLLDNGDVVIRRLRAKSFMGVVAGLIVVGMGLFLLVTLLRLGRPSIVNVVTVVTLALFFLGLGGVVLWYSTRSWLAPDIWLEVTTGTVRLRPFLFGTEETQPLTHFAEVAQTQRNFRGRHGEEIKFTQLSLKEMSGKEILLGVVANDAATVGAAWLTAALARETLDAAQRTALSLKSDEMEAARVTQAKKDQYALNVLLMLFVVFIPFVMLMYIHPFLIAALGLLVNALLVGEARLYTAAAGRYRLLTMLMVINGGLLLGMLGMFLLSGSAGLELWGGLLWVVPAALLPWVVSGVVARWWWQLRQHIQQPNSA